MAKRKRERLAWAAGFFDGEGNTGCRIRPQSRAYPDHLVRVISMSVGQRHREVLEKFQGAMQMGKIYSRITYDGKCHWDWRISGHEKVQAAGAMLWPWLGTVKKKQLVHALDIWRAHPIRGEVQWPRITSSSLSKISLNPTR